MKKVIYLAALVISFASCKKDEIKIEPLATVSVVNAVIDGKVARMNSALRDSCLNMGYMHFSILAGNRSSVKLFPSGSPGTPYYDQQPDTKAGEIYSLFLTGSHIAPESVLIKENIPPYPENEVINIRLVNVSPGSGALSLTTGNSPTVNVFSNVGYKQASEFKAIPFPMTLPANGNLFQIRDGAGNLLVTYTMPGSGTVSQTSSRKRNITLVVKGITGGVAGNAFGIIVLPHY